MIELRRTENGITEIMTFTDTISAAETLAHMFDVPIAETLQKKQAANRFNEEMRRQLKGLSSTDINDVIPRDIHGSTH